MTKMKAAFIEAINQSVVVRETDKPIPGNGEVVVKVKAAALNHRDVYIQQGLYAKIKLSVIPGSDGAGIVTDIGEGVKKQLVGEEVIINPGLNWGDNDHFQSKDFKILGMPDNGTLAEYVKVPADAVFPKPAHLDFTAAAALPLAGVTAYRAAIVRGHIKKGHKVLITGIGGGVAQMALLFAMAAGAEVYVTSSEAGKIEKARDFGAKGGANYKEVNWSKKLTDTAGRFNVIIDGAGGPGFASLVEIADYAGRIVMYGGTAGNIEKLSPQRIFWKQLQIIGSTMGTPAEFAAMTQFVNQHRINPFIDKVFPLDETEEAFKRMDEGKQFGKIIVKI